MGFCLLVNYFAHSVNQTCSLPKTASKVYNLTHRKWAAKLLHYGHFGPRFCATFSKLEVETPLDTPNYITLESCKYCDQNLPIMNPVDVLDVSILREIYLKRSNKNKTNAKKKKKKKKSQEIKENQTRPSSSLFS